MPVLRPEVSQVMEEALRKSRGQKAKQSTSEILEDEGLGLSDLIRSMRETRDMSDNPHLQSRINETFLKMHGVMKDETSAIPSITIVIADKDAPSINPILYPRELHKKETIQ